MEWIKIKITTNTAGIDFAVNIFGDAGIQSTEIEDCEEFLQVLEQTKKQWDFVEDELYREKSHACSVAGYAANNNTGKKTLQFITEKVAEAEKINGGFNFELFTAVINDEDWAENWKKYFKPLPLGKNILICPVWEEIPDEYKTRTVFKIDPGMSFGTGTHETTRLCICALEKYIAGKLGGAVLDLGCGSGILSIIAMLLGTGEAYAVDIDENCAAVAENNAKINNTELSKYNVYSGNLLTDKNLTDTIKNKKYDIILMNIIPDVIIPFLPLVKDLLSADGTVILSGIIGRYLPDVENAVNLNGMQIIEETSENDWQCVVARRL